ncbi:MAG: peptidoglycan DD-metalloendopeptidase family protein [Zoogloeaceae bacterium]|nr:peptidoglycan DD-metalloendopeptidase family protein [Zoogloeaceae bacterium]
MSFVRVLFLSMPLLCLTAGAQAQTQEKLSESQADLKTLRGNLEALQNDLAQSESAHAGEQNRLREAEVAIEAANQKLSTLRDNQRQLQKQLQGLSRQTRDESRALSVNAHKLEKLLARRYMQGSPGALQLMLNGDDPAQMARDMAYLSILAHRQNALIDDMRAAIVRHGKLLDETQSQADALAQNEQAQKEAQQKLLAQKAERQKIVETLSRRIKTQKDKIGELAKDEKRLTGLIDRLNKVLAEEAAKEAARQKEAARRAAEEKKRREQEAAQAARRQSAAGQIAKAPEPTVGENRLAPVPTSGRFAALKGKLRLPAQGSVRGKFGAPRDGGGTWKGLFIAAPEGAPVKAVAAGRVVYSDWMRGFGYLIIIDHGAGYMTIYGYNQRLTRQIGDAVEGGQTIGMTGVSGGQADPGVYFELRHQGKVQNPMNWVSLK